MMRGYLFMNCKQCKKEYTPKLKAHNSLFCSTKCRGKASYQARKEYHKEYQAKKNGSYAPNKIECRICGLYYKKVCVFKTLYQTTKVYKKGR